MGSKESSDRTHNRGKGQYDPTTPYEDTFTYTEAMRARGYRYVDGKWVP